MVRRVLLVPKDKCGAMLNNKNGDILMNKRLWFGVSLSVVIGSSAWAGTMGDKVMGIDPGFIVGVEGGVANVDWPYSAISFNNGIGNNGGSTSGYDSSTLLKTSSTNSFVGTVGAFIGYKFPISANIAFTPMVAYHYIANSWIHGTADFSVSDSSSSPAFSPFPATQYSTEQSKFNIVDLTIQGNYRLYNGVNFFLQPGVAIVINQFNVAYTTSPVDGPKGPLINTAEINAAGTSTAFRPEVAVGFGKMVTDHVNVFAKYTFILGNPVNVILPVLTPNISTINLGLSFEA